MTNASLPALAGVTQIFSVTQAGAYVAVDVTSLVQGWVSGSSPNYGLALTAGAASLQLDSKENDQTAHPAALDIVLASQGPTGAGWGYGAGTAGSVGQTGATVGQAGPAGPVGATGPAGPVGASGPVRSGWACRREYSFRLSYQGTYASTGTNYARGRRRRVSGIELSLSDCREPWGDTRPNAQQWGLLAQGGAGATGATGATVGPAGPQGPIGAQGTQGVTGSGRCGWAATGAQGLPGLTYQGNYQSTTNYNLGDVVSVAGNDVHVPDCAEPWEYSGWESGRLGCSVRAGADGSHGADGSTGCRRASRVAGIGGASRGSGSAGIAGDCGAGGSAGADGGERGAGTSGAYRPAGRCGTGWVWRFAGATSRR